MLALGRGENFAPRTAPQRAGPQTGNGVGDHLRGPARRAAFFCGAPPYIRCPARVPVFCGARSGDLAGGSKNGAPEVRGPGRGKGRGEKKKIPRPAPQCGAVRCGDFSRGPACPGANTNHIGTLNQRRGWEGIYRVRTSHPSDSSHKF